MCSSTRRRRRKRHVRRAVIPTRSRPSSSLWRSIHIDPFLDTGGHGARFGTYFTAYMRWYADAVRTYTYTYMLVLHPPMPILTYAYTYLCLYLPMPILTYAYTCTCIYTTYTQRYRSQCCHIHIYKYLLACLRYSSTLRYAFSSHRRTRLRMHTYHFPSTPAPVRDPWSHFKSRLLANTCQSSLCPVSSCPTGSS
ncbi:hypothetical protein F4803DRAFT_91637 [Xylaria telfairii]|nr:hypothetical protein F4803DRAFT_91637 [Xylaria telfairii]